MMPGCDGHDSRLSPFRWEPAGGEFDSLTVAFDYATWRGASPDSMKALAARAKALADQDPGNRLKQSRAHFFRGVILFKESRRDEADREFQTARDMTDSAAYPYDVSRIDFWLVDAKRERRGIGAYLRTMEKISFYEEAGDSALLAMQYGDLGLLLKNYGDPEEACRAFETATRLFEHSGLPEHARANIINITSCLERMGRTVEGSDMLRRLVNDSVFQKNRAGYPTALHNLYYWDGDTAALRRALPLVMASELPINYRLRGRMLAEYSHELMRRGFTDSAYIYSEQALGYLEPSYMADSAYILLNHSRVLEQHGDVRGALATLRRWEDIAQRMADERDSEAIQSLTTSRLVADARMQAQLEHAQRKMFWVILSLSLLLVLVVVLWIFHRERQRQQLHRMKSELEKGTLQSKIMSMQIATKDNDSFLYTFASINPNFTQRLKEAYPDLSPMDLKLAAFAALKLDIKQVARILGIKPESVKQSRWRLRRKLGLAPDQNLEDTLRPYLDEAPD